MSTLSTTHLENSDGISIRSKRRRHPNPNSSMTSRCERINFLITPRKYFREYVVKAALSTPSVLLLLIYTKKRKRIL
jgi:hypothetical protein